MLLLARDRQRERQAELEREGDREIVRQRDRQRAISPAGSPCINLIVVRFANMQAGDCLDRLLYHIYI